MATDLLKAFIREHYEVHEWKHACAILKQEFQAEWDYIVAVLTKFRLLRSQLVKGGGRKSDPETSKSQVFLTNNLIETRTGIESPRTLK